MSWQMKTLTAEEVRAMKPVLVVRLLTHLCSQIPKERAQPSDHNMELLLGSLYDRLGISSDTGLTQADVTAALYEQRE